MKTIASIRNPHRWWPRWDDYRQQAKRARKNHKRSAGLEREAKKIMTAILAYENRKDAA
jgi:hypothetical protein